MRLFQISHIYIPYILFFEKKYQNRQIEQMGYEEHRKLLISDGFYAPHILKPAIELERNAFYTLWNYKALQLKWAEEQGWKETDLKKILFAQLEDFRPDVFYSLSPYMFTKKETEEAMPSNMLKVCWCAAPSVNESAFPAFKTRLTNYPKDIKPIKEGGFRNDLFQPSTYSYMNEISQNTDRPIDLFFYGQYSEYAFKSRNKKIDLLLEWAASNPQFNIEFSLMYKERRLPKFNLVSRRLTQLGTKFFFKKYPSRIVRTQSTAPYFGTSLYERISRSKMVFNSAVDFTGDYNVNMRNFEALACGAHMISNQGIYPKGFEPNKTFTAYQSIEDCIEKIEYYLTNLEQSQQIANNGSSMVQNIYSKKNQWENFQQILGTL